MNITIDIQDASANGDSVPEPEPIKYWIEKTLAHPALNALLPSDDTEIELSLRIVGNDESQQLNNQYRQKNYPTNILSFPSELPEDLPFFHLGDLVVCAPVVKNEANEQRKTVSDHWAHMLVHGTLHLFGFDHIDDEDAEKMEALEIDILSTLNIENPYTSTVHLRTAE